ncbi:MAG TPA: RodZ domain-containing protein [Rudaea sp.]|nr:RodZ domain-containing protein [Rudaea sp.]
MSKRRNKNKFRFHPHAASHVEATEQQSLLPLADTDPKASDAAPVELVAEETVLPVCVDSDAPPVAAEPAPSLPACPPAPTVTVDASLGHRLRAAREARGMSCDAASRVLKLPITVVKALEAEQFERIGHGVFLRGYLSKYLQLLDLPQVLADRVVQDHAELPPLTTNGTISHPRYLFERYSGSALYLILTGVIVVPAVLLALRAGFDQNLTRITPLDTPPPAVTELIADHVVAAPIADGLVSQPATRPAVAPAPAKPDETPLVASMTPFPAAAADKKPAAVSAPASKPGNRMHLSLTQASWVEIVDAAGTKIEYGLLPAGSERDYASDQALDIRIGNADGASLTIDGKALDLAAFRRANVAHLKLVGGAASTVHGG